MEGGGGVMVSSVRVCGRGGAGTVVRVSRKRYGERQRRRRRRRRFQRVSMT